MRTIMLVIATTACMLMAATPVEADPDVREPDDQDNTWTEEDECLSVDYTKNPPVFWQTC